MPALGNPTRADLRGRVRVFIDEVTQANFTDTSINYALNEAQQRVAVEIAQATEDYFVNPVPVTITILNNVAQYALAADCYKPIKVVDSNTGLRIPYRKFGQVDQAPAIASTPLFGNGYFSPYSFSMLGNFLVFNPTPTDTSFTPQYWYVPVLPDMTSDTDNSSIPRPFVDLLCLDAAIDMLIQDEDDISPLQGKFNYRWAQMIKASRDRQQQEPRRVTRSGY